MDRQLRFLFIAKRVSLLALSVTEKKSDPENSYASKAGFIIYSHDKVDNLFHQYEYLGI
jgi:hypothetical protein